MINLLIEHKIKIIKMRYLLVIVFVIFLLFPDLFFRENLVGLFVRFIFQPIALLPMFCLLFLFGRPPFSF